MNECGDLDNPDKELPTPSHSFHMESGGPDKTPAGSSEKSSKRDDNQRKRYDTPPASIVEAVSPVSSRKRGQLRAESLGIGPSTNRILRIPPPGFGAGLFNLPPPITTSPPLASALLQSIREPLPTAPGPSIDATLQRITRNFELEQARFAENQHGLPLPSPAYQNRPYDYRLEDRAEETQELHGDNLKDGNPYEYRADEIGPSHRIPGLGHLGGLLTPPGWTVGEEPISPQKAEALYHTARKDSKAALELDLMTCKNLTPEEQERRGEERDERWARQLRIDQLLLEERENVWRMHKQGQSTRFQEENARQQMKTHTLLPPRYSQSFAPRSPIRITSQSALNDSSHVFRDQQDRADFQPPMGGYISHRDIDPSLLPKSLEAVIARYNATRGDIIRRKNENDQYLSSWLSHIGPYFSNGPTPPGYGTPPVTGQQARPFASIHAGYVPSTGSQSSPGIPRPPPYESPTNSRFRNSHYSLQESPHLMRRPSYGAPEWGPKGRDWVPEDNSIIRVENGMDMTRPIQGVEGQNMHHYATSERKESPQPPMKKRGPTASKTKAQKQKPWYHDDMVSANLPTSIISKEAMQAGFDFVQNESSTQRSASKTASAPKVAPRKRGRKPKIDPTKGMAVSKEAAQALIANGAMDTSKKQYVPAMYTSGTPTTPLHTSTDVDPNYDSPYKPHPGEKIKYVFSTQPAITAGRSSSPRVAANVNHGVRAESRLLDSSPEKCSSSDSPDDPRDVSFGKKTPRHKATRSSTAPTSGKKRKPATNAATAKRNRFDLDGAKDSDRDCMTPNKRLAALDPSFEPAARRMSVNEDYDDLDD